MKEIRLSRSKKIPMVWWGSLLIALVVLFGAAIIGVIIFLASASGSVGAIGGVIGAVVTMPFAFKASNAKGKGDSDSFEVLAISEECITHKIGIQYVNTVRWHDIEIIQYNSKTISIAHSTIVWGYEPEIISTIKAIITKHELKTVVEEVAFALAPADEKYLPMTKYGYTDYVFEKEYYIGGVNIFDYHYPDKKKGEKLIEIKIMSERKLYSEKALLRFFNVTGALLNFKVGIAEFSLNRYAVFFPHKEKAKLYLHYGKVNGYGFVTDDYSKNSENKLKAAIRIEKEKQNNEYDVVYGEATNNRCKITKNSENYSVQRELLVLNYPFGAIDEDFYRTIQIGRNDITAKNLDEAVMLAEKELNKKFLLSTSNFDLLQKNKQETAAKNDEYFLQQLSVIFRELDQFEFYEHGIYPSDLATKELSDKIREAHEEIEIIALLRATLLENFDDTEIEAFFNKNSGMQVLSEATEYITEFCIK